MSFSPKISLCVIVKDQADLLRRLLVQHRDIYDEAIVVDTGSTDDSAVTAAGLGAVVHEHPWNDDFSAARNHGLDMATGDWILVLDCDELMAPDSFGSIRGLTWDEPRSCFTFPQLNYLETSRGIGWEPTRQQHREFALGSPGYLTAWTIRLFPNLNTMRYKGQVHESLDSAAGLSGLKICRRDFPIHHQGHVLARESSRNRTAFYGQLLKKKIASQPDDPQARYEMATHLAGVGQSSLAMRLLERTLRDFPHWNDRYRAGLLLGQIKVENGELAAAASLFQEALESRPDWSICWESVISSQLALNDHETADRYLSEARKLFPLRPVWEGFEAQVSGKSGR